MQFKALYAIDKASYLAIMEDGTLARLQADHQALLIDGVYAVAGDGKLEFHAAPTLRQQDVERVLATSRRRILRYLERRGVLAPVPTGGDGGISAASGGDSRESTSAMLPLASPRRALGPGNQVDVRFHV